MHTRRDATWFASKTSTPHFNLPEVTRLMNAHIAGVELTTYCFFVSGLALVASAAILLANRTRGMSLALTGLAIAEGLLAWLELSGRLGNRPAIYGSLGLVMQVGALVALFELALERFSLVRIKATRAGYVVLAAAAIAAFATGEYGRFEIGYRLVLAIAGSVLAGRLVFESLAGEKRNSMFALLGGATIVYLAANCFGLSVFAAIAALIIACGSWSAHRECQSADERGSAARQCRWPAAFVLLLVAGCFGLGMYGASGSADLLANGDQMSQDLDDLLMIEGDVEPAPTSGFVAAMQKFGLAMLPIVGLVVFVFLLSRMPFAQ